MTLARSKPASQCSTCDPVWNAAVTVNGRPTEVYGIDPAQGVQPELQVLIIPGNPGFAGFYEPFIIFLSESLKVPTRIRAVSHLGFGSIHKQEIEKRVKSTELFTVDEQVQHKIQFVKEHMQGNGHVDNPPIVIVGHSLGAHMASKVVNSLQSSGDNRPQISKCIMCFPFLGIDPASSTQHLLKWLAAFPLVLVFTLFFTTLLMPRFAKRALISRMFGLTEHHAVETCVDMLSPLQVWRVLLLGGNELAALNGGPNWDQLANLGQRLTVIAEPNDSWFPAWQCRDFIKQLPAVKVTMEPEQSHSFCTSSKLSNMLARSIAACI